MYNRIFTYCILLISMAFAGCGDEPGKDAKTAESNAANPAASTRFPKELTAAELADDSVFSDGSRPVSWENAGVTDPVRLKKFIRQLQIWVDENQVDSISRYMLYPVKNPGIADAKDFKLNYQTYFSDGVKAALADQKLNQVFRNEQGAMIGQGQIWFIEKDNKIMILAINN